MAPAGLWQLLDSVAATRLQIQHMQVSARQPALTLLNTNHWPRCEPRRQWFELVYNLSRADQMLLRLSGTSTSEKSPLYGLTYQTAFLYSSGGFFSSVVPMTRWATPRAPASCWAAGQSNRHSTPRLGKLFLCLAIFDSGGLFGNAYASISYLDLYNKSRIILQKTSSTI